MLKQMIGLFFFLVMGVNIHAMRHFDDWNFDYIDNRDDTTVQQLYERKQEELLGRIERGELSQEELTQIVHVAAGGLPRVPYRVLYEVVEACLQKGASTVYKGCRDSQEPSALLAACKNMNLEMVYVLLHNGADVEYRGRRGRTLLTAFIDPVLYSNYRADATSALMIIPRLNFDDTIARDVEFFTAIRGYYLNRRRNDRPENLKKCVNLFLYHGYNPKKRPYPGTFNALEFARMYDETALIDYIEHDQSRLIDFLREVLKNAGVPDGVAQPVAHYKYDWDRQ